MKSENIVKFYHYKPLSEKQHLTFLENYLKQTVWFTPLKEFNDPFEGKFLFKGFTPEYILNNPSLLNHFLKHYQGRGEPNLTANDLKVRLGSPEFQQIFNQQSHQQHQMIKDAFSNHGALCLTPKNNNIPMSAYYANDHKGYCVEFSVDFTYIQKHASVAPNMLAEFIHNINTGTSILSFQLKEHGQEFVFTKVRYSNEIPTIDLEVLFGITNEYKQTEYLVKNSVGVKLSDWDHENEYRLIANSNSKNCGLMSLQYYAPFLKVTAIIMGACIEKENEEEIRKLCKTYGIRLYKAVCSEFAYEFTILLSEEKMLSETERSL
ncbi:DUF2971 domain-containing protein [Candidatus Berkiella aquae]|uniref:DUF2971 domain-containing protein n=1 Tax=Candidatus Berkiella aquae TaxID=295108 RepID=A0A0Q9Z2J0_9GAMM|nr:DUF2971 domain-containing protein [Candidatus Berkiella aquae]MCS5711963.1 DUF2971 domain-containing protein [Candidatus Berkiella aquae]